MAWLDPFNPDAPSQEEPPMQEYTPPPEKSMEERIPANWVPIEWEPDNPGERVQVDDREMVRSNTPMPSFLNPLEHLSFQREDFSPPPAAEAPAQGAEKAPQAKAPVSGGGRPSQTASLGVSEDVWSLTAREEGVRNKSYTLDSGKYPESGVTVATGLDIGQWTEKGLKTLGMPEPLLERMRPYIGKKGKAAEELHGQQGGFELTDQEVRLVDTLLKADALRAINTDLLEKTGKLMDDFPLEAQQVMVSMYHNFGAKVFKYGTWKELVDGNYGEAARRLRNTAEWKSLHERRAREADVLSVLAPREPTIFPGDIAQAPDENIPT